MILNDTKSECIVGPKVLRLNENVDYKSAVETKASIGKILAFKYAGKFDSEDQSSVWMQVQDKETEKKEWISVSVWAEQFITEKETPKNDTGTEQEDSEGYPF